ncbi:putative methylated-DNA:protein-cysteine S-methyltransferase [Actinacidiphila reveromycinica]|uniref:Methylated-DNA--protein-cysteine methyltransferase n=1 Tax=Actinacidiphila reveromycinica TaxID=659352 RepID=A0A7U3USI4_9ACTN|nr:methylated-DNA--[protein]-cysteine S-methyltransferase [Streptomyces sp. SN-593]BBA97816.1 putative methylated-DNA:protein-cysteine S-methyltransferase [Streptomyces sp. SN-593]
MSTATTTPTAPAVHTVVDSPCGPLTLVAREGELSGLYMTDHRHIPPSEAFGPRAALPAFDRVREQLAAYFDGDLTVFDLPLHMAGTPFQKRVWAALCDIPYGETATYGELAAALGSPTASRAVGLANGRNPVSIIVPCHRVVGANGSLTGYGGGLARKQLLLELERGTQQPTLM